MQVIKQKQTNVVDAPGDTTIYEYLMSEKKLSGATATVTERYPKKGFATNEVAREMVLVIDGNGIIGVGDKETPVEIGDCIYIDAKEKFYWSGMMTLFMVCTPAFDPKQHTIIHE
jgi:mannose-6-phosphate isomerase-like protein (cupin superfamily)